MKNTLLLLICILLCAPGCKTNKLDKQLRKQGVWKKYYDDAHRHLLYKGHYTNDRPTGKWKYAYPDGNIYLREKYLADDWVKVIHYYPNGTKQMEGMARYIVNPDTIFYRWEGNWTKYDSAGRVARVDYYKFGKFAWENKQLKKN